MPALDRSSPGKYLPVDEPRLAPSEVDSISPSVQVKMFVEKKVTSSDNQAIRQACLKLNIDESYCRRYLQHLEFLALKADKRNLERNTIPEDICWESSDDVERLTNKQLRLYLRQEGLMVSGNKAQLVQRILKHTDGSVARTYILMKTMKTCPPVLMMIPQVILRRSQPSMKVVHQATIMCSAAQLPSFIYW